MAMQNQNKDQQWLMTILSEHKLGCSTLTSAILESANDQIRSMFMDHLTKYFDMQKQCFNNMQQHGWYQVAQAQQQEFTRVQQSMTQLQTQTQQTTQQLQ